MRWQYAILALGLVASAASAETFEEEDGDARLGYISVGSSGATSITFNATSIQNAVILGLFTLVLGALILPLFGVSLGSLFGGDSSDSGTDSDDDDDYVITAYVPNEAAEEDGRAPHMIKVKCCRMKYFWN